MIKNILKKILIPLILILMYELPNSIYYFLPKIALLIVILIFFFVEKESASYIFYSGALIILFDLIKSEVYNHSFFTSIFSLSGPLPLIGYGFLIIIGLVCIALYVYAWIKIIIRLNGMKELQIIAVSTLLAPHIYALIKYQTLYFTNIFYTFLVGITVILFLKKNASRSSISEYLIGPYLLIVLINTHVRYYRVIAIWGIALDILIICFLLLYPIIKQKRGICRHQFSIFFFEIIISVALLIYEVINKPIGSLLIENSFNFIQFFIFQLIFIVFFRTMRSNQLIIENQKN